jgi:hypothetical protein
VSFITSLFLISADKLFSETKQKTLEEIAAAFGDKVMLPSENAFVAEDAIFEDDSKSVSEQVERV